MQSTTGSRGTHSTSTSTASRPRHSSLTSAAASRTLVIALAWGYKVDIYKAFILSLRQTAGYSGEISILAPPNRTLPACASLCAQHNVHLVDFASLGYEPGKVPPKLMGERFRMYSRLCIAGTYSWCLAADFRDVFFQRDPFSDVLRGRYNGVSLHELSASSTLLDRYSSALDTAELVLPAEDRTVGTCPVNSKVVRTCFGARALAQMHNQSVLCSGVLLGTPKGFALLSIISDLVKRCPFDKMADQGSLLYAAYVVAPSTGGAPASPPLRWDRDSVPAVVQPRGTGIVNTVGIFKGTERTLAFERAHMRAGVVLNDDHKPSPIVHQYDRILRSTGPGGYFGRTQKLLRLKAIDDALGESRADAAWLPLGAR